MKIVYLDCICGISGDMTLAALADAGADRAYIEHELAKLPVEPYAIEWKNVNKKGITALKVDVVPDAEHAHPHHRHYSDIVRMIQDAGLPERAAQRSLAIFEKIGQAEAKIHGIPLERVHFHEVGAVDSIVDTVGVALALESLEVDEIVCSPVPLGYGTVVCAHGVYPVPAPATLEMMKGLPTAYVPIGKELTTPTGAGIVSGLAKSFDVALPAMNMEAVGYGAGTRDLPERPNVLRVVIGRMTEALPHDRQHHHHHHHQ
ncbi:LarC family nickel insertion protein [Cohnella cellulosilytica]|uniref:LarC family nickel insertion protein n=1 Tax=Cohnella cellulosilytica TaxID=986710 RepID=A0ABW2F7S2_9BACL